MEDGVLVVGGGGHALVSIEVLRACGLEVAGCLTRDGSAAAELDRVGVGVLGPDGDLAGLVAHVYQRAFIAVGDNRDRQRLSEIVIATGGSLVSAVSPAAVVSATADVDDGVLVMPGAIVNAVAHLGRGAIVNTHSSVDHGCRIGAFAHVAPGVAIAGDVTVGEGALVGVGASVARGVCIGAWATVGAGAAVVRDVEPGETVVGVPARPIHPDRP